MKKSKSEREKETDRQTKSERERKKEGKRAKERKIERERSSVCARLREDIKENNAYSPPTTRNHLNLFYFILFVFLFIF